jgi:serine/threonine protein kinase
MSPEAISGAQLSNRSDIFSVGVLAYELVAGVNPFAGPQETIAQRVCNEKERLPSQVNGNVPAVFDLVCATALAKMAEQRYPTARAFAEEVRVAFENAYGAAPRNLVSNETVVSIFLASLRGPSKRRSPSTAVVPKAEPPKAAAPPASTWEPSVLRTVERQLAAFVGPLARMIVREAASRSQNVDELYSTAAESLEKDDDRKLFLAGRKMIQQHPVRNEAAPSPFVSPEAETAMLGPELPVSPEHAATPNLKPAPPVLETPGKDIHAAPPENAKRSEPQFASFESSNFADTGPKELKGLGVELNREKQAPLTPSAKSQANSAQPSARSPKTNSAPEQVKQEEDVDVVSRLEEILGKQPENLAGYLREDPPEMEEVIHAFVATLEAVAAMYVAKGKLEAIVPQNICFDRLGKATIQSSPMTLTQSTSGSGVGSPRYAAPEILAENGAADPTGVAGNVYALGFMFYEILLGRKLFRKTFAKQRNELDWLRWHAALKSKAPALRSLLPDRPAALSDLLENMIEKDVAARITDLQTILSRLRTIAQQANRTLVLKKPTISRKVPTKDTSAKTRTSSRSLLIFSILLVILAGTALFVWRNPDLYHKLLSPFQRPRQTTDQPSSR